MLAEKVKGYLCKKKLGIVTLIVKVLKIQILLGKCLSFFHVCLLRNSMLAIK